MSRQPFIVTAKNPEDQKIADLLGSALGQAILDGVLIRACPGCFRPEMVPVVLVDQANRTPCTECGMQRTPNPRYGRSVVEELMGKQDVRSSE